MDRLYCTLGELLDDLGAPGDKDPVKVLSYIRWASQWIDQNLGQFIPVTEAKRFDGEGGTELQIEPLLAVTSIVDDDDTLQTADYLLYPRNKLWENGPYVWIELDPDATTINSWTNERDIVVITGRWGLFELTRDTGATGTLSDASDTSLVVDDASKIWPGAVLKIEDEQCLVEDWGAATDSSTDLAEALDNNEEEIDVDDGSVFAIGEIEKVDFEQMKILDINTNKLYVDRGYNGTKKATHADNTSVFVYRTFTVKRGINGTTAVGHSSKSVSRYVPPDDVNYLCRQMASLAWNKARSGFSGQVGNPDLGEVTFYQEFPKEVIRRIEESYFVPLF